MLRPPEKILGVLGGMGPAASAEFMRLLTEKAPASCDQEHPVVYMISDCHVPDRVEAILGTGENPTERLKKDLETLAAWGADYLVTACNTAHVFIDTFCDALPVPYLHIGRETIRSCRMRSPQGAWLLATVGTCRTGLYEKYAREAGYTLYSVSPVQQEKIQNCVELVKAGKLQEAGNVMRTVTEELWQEKDILVATACTELPLAYTASGQPGERAVSSLDALVEASLEVLYPGVYTRG